MKATSQLVACSLFFLSCAQPDSRPVYITTSPEPRAVTAAGEAEVRVVPDEVQLSVGVETADPVLATAKSRNDEAVRKIHAAATSHGVEVKDIQSEYLSIDPRYRDYHERKELVNYVVYRFSVVTLRKVNRFEEVLTAVLEAGANNVSGIQFRTTELRKHRDQARELAIKAAKEKAAALAQGLGQEIDRPILIEEEQSSWFYPFGSWGRWGGGQMSQNVVQNVAPSQPAGDSTLAPGMISVSARVRVKFELK